MAPFPISYPNSKRQRKLREVVTTDGKSVQKAKYSGFEPLFLYHATVGIRAVKNRRHADAGFSRGFIPKISWRDLKA
jgi:hypothetical protein